jgi:F0F1-type ATP synthase membrane subunit b/b'
METWLTIAKNFGFSMLAFGLAVFAIWKILLPWIKDQQKEYTASLQAAIQDARSERDDMRKSRDLERMQFLDALANLTRALDQGACRYISKNS